MTDEGVAPQPTPPRIMKSETELRQIFEESAHKILGDATRYMERRTSGEYIRGDVNSAFIFFRLGFELASAAAEARTELPGTSTCPTCGHTKMTGTGDYSCASCGMGMDEPCEHWKAMLAESDETMVEGAAETLQPTLPPSVVEIIAKFVDGVKVVSEGLPTQWEQEHNRALALVIHQLSDPQETVELLADLKRAFAVGAETSAECLTCSTMLQELVERTGCPSNEDVVDYVCGKIAAVGTETRQPTPSIAEKELRSRNSDLRRIMAAMHITWDEETGYEVPAEPEPQYFEALVEAVEFWVKLVNRAEGAETAPRWIPVSEELPHTHTVLGIILGRYGGKPYVDSVCYFPAHDPVRMVGGDLPHGEWRTNGDDDEPGRGVVTVIAWQEMPDPYALPAPPVAKKENTNMNRPRKNDPDSNRGLYEKFTVIRNLPSDKHKDCRYFVLDVTHDAFAADALRAYANACEADYPILTADIRDMIAVAPESKEKL